MSVNAKTTFHLSWQKPKVDRIFNTGVSLHSHTQFSEESLDLLPKYVGQIPLVGQTLGNSIPYGQAYWTPPLTPRQAYRLEEKQIGRKFQLPALVSLTDHDTLEAGRILHVFDRFWSAPISTEWTIPFGSTFFHLGVHNLPVSHAEAIMSELRGYTAHPTALELGRLLAMLHAIPDVLVVANHPLWDEKGIGQSAHRQTLTNLLTTHGHLLHALEVNGLRSWRENERVLELGERLNLPVVAGGDRHGWEPNAVLNLSRARTFHDFVQEIRTDRISHIAFMPQYRTSRTLRTTRLVLDALQEYPQRVHARRTWRERVFYRPTPASEPVPLSALWAKGNTPVFVRALDGILAFIRSSAMRPVTAYGSTV